MDADADGVGFHVAFSNHEHGVHFHLLGALDFAVDLVGAFVDFRADLMSAQFLQNRSRVIELASASSPMVMMRTCSGESQSGKLPA